MDGGARLRTWWLALATVMCSGAAANAGELFPWSRWSCPRSSYCATFSYVAPTPWRVCSWTQRDGAYIYAANTHPELPLHYQDVRFRCPMVPPEQYPFPPYELNPRWLAPKIEQPESGKEEPSSK